MKALTVRQPWAWLLIYGGKDIENRDWWCGYRGPLAIHAAKGMTVAEYEDARRYVEHFNPALSIAMPQCGDLTRGAIIGTMRMRGWVRSSDSQWFQGRYGFVLSDPVPMAPVFVKGALGLWELEESTGVGVKPC